MRSWQIYGIAALLWAAIFLPGLGDPELKGEEGRRILPARTMLRTGEWIVPYSEGKPYSRKPPMINWAIAATFHTTGIENEWTARLPSVLAILAGTIAILWAGRALLNDSGALVAALSFLACVAHIDKGRLAEIEALYVALTAIAMAMWLRLWYRQANPWLTYSVPWLILGLGILTKGPVHLIFVYGVLFCILREARQIRELIRLPHLIGVAIMCSVFLPWAALNAQRTAELDPDQSTSQTVWLQQITERLDPGGIDWTNYFLVPVQGILNFAPWVFFIAVCWRQITPWSRTEPESLGNIMRGLKWGILITFLVVSLIPESRPRFTMPLFGSSAILTGWVATRAWDDYRVPIQFWWKCVLRILMIVIAVLAIAIPAIITTSPGALPVWIGVGIAIVLFGLQRTKMESLHSLAIGTTSLMAAAVIMIATDTRHLQEKNADVRPLGQAISAALPQDAKLTVFKPGPQPFLFYVTQDYIIADRPSQIPTETTYLLLRPEHHERVFRRKSLADRGIPTEIIEVKARDGKRYKLLQLP
ncbi:MAG: 4-amino-4-deoxy-L-arabinose transferase-like glycosyltransferase [Verrucomicrobiales bacterium]|jgi:4-amino-4-deoxy-L-arabinose transferase-like glycosyltransferase